MTVIQYYEIASEPLCSVRSSAKQPVQLDKTDRKEHIGTCSFSLAR